MLRFHDAVSLPKTRRKERADARLEKNTPLPVVDEERPTRELDTTAIVGGAPPLPERAWRVAEHGATVETLAVA
jgi:hypothetical protein